MNLGKNILDLRKQKNITQEELAAELGVTAAAVSKWENNYTLPDILMLCALADFFDVTTDELLGRHKEKQLAVIATDSPELGKSVAQLVNRYGFTVREICSSIGDARNAVKAEPAIGHIFASFSRPLSEDEQEDIPKKTCVVEVHSDNGDVLDGFELYLKNMTTLASLVQK